MKASEGNILQILNSQKQYIVPLYQRMYSWRKEQYKRLWEDIVLLGKGHKCGHFLGSVVSVVESVSISGTPKFLVIDGQQRLTTLTILLIALRDFLKSSNKINSITEKFLINITTNEEEKYKLILTYNDKETLIKLINKVPFNDIKKSRIIDAYNFFMERISSNELMQQEIEKAISKLQIVDISLDSSIDDPQSIFESLNSTGLNLSQSDLIRNFILMGLSIKEQSEIYKNIWLPMEKLFDYENQSNFMDSFFRDYITMNTSYIPTVENVYFEFKQFCLQVNLSKTDLCKEIYEKAKNYTNMIFLRENDAILNTLFEDIKLLKIEVAYPFLMYVYCDFTKGIISKEEFIAILRMSESYVFRRAICEIPTNSLNKTFAGLKNKIKNEAYLDSIKAAFVLFDSYKEFPKDSDFVQHFTEKDIYNMRIRNYILSKLERFDNKEKLDLSVFTIEHIMPKNLGYDWQVALGKDWEELHKQYLHTIGNLTLTAYNSEMSNLPFRDKLTMTGGFLDSGLKLNSYIRHQKKWNVDKIKERANILADNALKIWEYPQISDEEVQKFVPQTLEKEIYDFEQHRKNFSNETLSLYEELDKRIMNLDASVKKEYLKHYIAYKVDTNFVDIVPLKKSLRLGINIKYDKVYDPNCMCEDVSEKGTWENGDVRINITNLNQLDYVMMIIKQSLNLQLYN